MRSESGFQPAALARARDEVGLSQTALADALDTTAEVVRMWESGAVTPRPANVSRIASALGVSTEKLYSLGGIGGYGLDDLRVLAGLSQRQLANRMGVNQTDISKWETAKQRLGWQHVTAYVSALGIPQSSVSTAVEVTGHRYGPFPRLPQGDVPLPQDFRIRSDSPHAVYETAHPQQLSEHDVGAAAFKVVSPQFPKWGYRCKSADASNVEIAMINEHLEADYLGRYNHIQWLFAAQVNAERVYRIRWQDSAHDGRVERAALAAMLHQALTTADLAGEGQAPEELAETLLIVVTQTDTIGWIRRQLRDGEATVLAASFKHEGIRPNLRVITRAGGSLSLAQMPDSVCSLGLSDDSTYLDLVQAVQATFGVTWTSLNIAEQSTGCGVDMRRIPLLFNRQTPKHRSSHW